MIDDMVNGLVRIMQRRSENALQNVIANEVENLRTFTKAYQAVLDTNATLTISVDFDLLDWMRQNFSGDMGKYRLDEGMRLTLRRARGSLPNAKLESVDASSCSQQQFTEWLYFIRNTRGYVEITSTKSEAA
jgi:hypothetical protein